MEVVSLKPRPNPEAVKAAKEILAKAEAGEINEIMAAAYQPDGVLITWLTGTTDQLRRVAGLARLLHRAHILVDETLR